VALVYRVTMCQRVLGARVVSTYLGIIKGRTVKNIKLGRNLGAPAINPAGHLEGNLVA